MSIIPGSLYVVSTPIGNLQDLSSRAIFILDNVDLIVAEDTRHSGNMLRNIGVDTPMLAYHDHNERQQVPALIHRLQKNETIALVSDAGTPLICDPGYRLVVAAHMENIRVIPVPGPSALVSALSVAGLATDRFVFEGYLPAKKVARMNRLRELATETRTMIFYEAPHRMIKSIDDAISCFGSERMGTLLKELTKLHETVKRDTLANLRTWLENDKVRQRGEFVIIVQGAEDLELDKEEAARILKILLQSVSVNEAVALATEIVHGRRNELYKLAMAIKDES